MNTVENDSENITPLETNSTSTAHYLISRFGVLMTIEQLAEVLGRKYHALHAFLYSKSEEAKKLNAAKKRIGRNVYFRTLDIAKIIEE